jgi:predicted nuclease of restriction endonuclease-like (RecB) superfamily
MTDKDNLKIDNEYVSLLTDLKNKIKTAQLKAVRAVNTELVSLYWEIGNQILIKQQNAKWGSKVLAALAHDLQNAFPYMKGFSLSNLKRMRLFSKTYPDLKKSPQAVGQLPWGHISLLLESIKDKKGHDWYASQVLENGWSRKVLDFHISQSLYERQGNIGAKVSNFADKLPAPQSDLAQQSLKDPYIFDFLTIGDGAYELELEKELTTHITKFLLELGTGFAFVGRQVVIEVGDENFKIDMLFYHLKLRCYVVIELKARQFKPTDAGQLNFYLTAVDEKIKHADDNPTIGILLCKSRNKVIAEYALRNVSSPIGVSEYQLTRMMPKDLKTSLPTIEEIEEELSNDLSKKDDNQDI